MLVEIEKIKVSNRIRKDFGNLDELAEDIRENGLINPPVVTPDLQLIAGERRLRACQKLGWKQIEVRIMTVRDAEHQLKLEINENENRKDFTFTEKMEWARRLERIEKAKAEARMKAGKDLNPSQNSDRGRSDDIVAKKSGFGSRDTYRKAKIIAEHGDEELISRLDAGEISIHKAYTEVMERLRQEEEARLKAEKRAKQAEQKAQEAESRLALALSQSEKEIEELKRQLERAREEVRIKEVIKEVPSKELLDKVSELEKRLQEHMERQRELQEEIRRKDDELLALTREEIRMKERHLIYENVSYLARDVKKWMGKLRLDIHKRAHIEGDEEVRRTLDACIAVLQEVIDEMKSWNDNLTKRGVIDAEYTVVAGSS